MRQEKNNMKTFIVSSIAVSLLSFSFFVILGTFYKATDHIVGLNVLIYEKSKERLSFRFGY